MKNAVFLFLISITCCITSCVNNTEEPKIDCSASDLGLVVKSSINASCQAPGNVTLEASGGSGNYEYSADGSLFFDSPILTGLSAGALNLTVRDVDGCTFTTSFVLEGDANTVNLTLNSTKSDCINSTGTITALAEGGSGDYMFKLDNGSFDASETFSSISSGLYNVTVKDSEGCEATKSVTVGTESNVSLSADIMPIVNTNCAISGCHNGTQSPNLSTASAVISNAGRIKAETQSKRMPQGRTLSDLQINQIACWVDAGAKDN